MTSKAYNGPKNLEHIIFSYLYIEISDDPSKLLCQACFVLIISNSSQIVSSLHSYAENDHKIPPDDKMANNKVQVQPAPSLPPPLTSPPPPPPASAVKREILKSIVFGGLTESITSLGVVTSAASADATTSKCLQFLFVLLLLLW